MVVSFEGVDQLPIFLTTTRGPCTSTTSIRLSGSTKRSQGGDVQEQAAEACFSGGPQRGRRSPGLTDQECQ